MKKHLETQPKVAPFSEVRSCNTIFILTLFTDCKHTNMNSNVTAATSNYLIPSLMPATTTTSLSPYQNIMFIDFI